MRNPNETRQVLRSQFTEASRVGGNAEFKRIKTRTGVKDTFQDFFTDQLFAVSMKKRSGTKDQKMAAMNKIKRTFPSEITSPVWRIKGMH